MLTTCSQAWFTSVTKIQHITPLPEGVPAEKVVKLLHGREFYLQCDPHMVKFETTDPPMEKPVIPADRNATAISEAACYKVTDKVNTIPGGLWDSNVVSTYEFLDVETGVFVRIRSPLNTVMETLWTVRENGEGKLELFEDVVITCSKLLVGTITDMCESGWKDIHRKMMDKVRDE